MKEVKLYTTSNCPFCQEAKSYLKNKGIDFKEIDLTDDQSASLKLVKKTGYTSVPQIQIGQEFVIGFDKEKIDELLSKD